MSAERIVHVIVTGRVQGVGFRAWVHHQAELHGLEGFVRNRSDGTVEAAFAGAETAIDAMLRACRTGPAGSRVENVAVEEGKSGLIPHQGSGRFEVLRTV